MWVAIFVWGFAACCINFGEDRSQGAALSALGSAWWRPPVVPSNNGTRLARGQPASVPPTAVASLPALPLPAAANVFFLNKMAAPKDPIVVSEEAYAVQVRSRTGLDADAVMASLAGGRIAAAGEGCVQLQGWQHWEHARSSFVGS